MSIHGGRSPRAGARYPQAILYAHAVVGDLVYPPVCPACGVGTGRRASFCPTCWSEIRFIERPYCDILGILFSYDPGEGMVSAEAIYDQPVFNRLHSVAIHQGLVRQLVHGLKSRHRTDLAPMMAVWMLPAWMLPASDGFVARSDAIVPVPLHRWRFVSRKFNQSAELARLGRAVGSAVPAEHAGQGEEHLMRGRSAARGREESVRAAFKVVPGREIDLAGKHVLLVDDVLTTGATVSSAIRALTKAGDAEVTVLTFAMAVAAPI